MTQIQAGGLPPVSKQTQRQMAQFFGQPDPFPELTCPGVSKNYRSVELDVWEPFPCRFELDENGVCPGEQWHLSLADLERLDHDWYRCPCTACQSCRAEVGL